MSDARPSDRQRVVVVTGGGGGIGAAIAEELGRTGVHVVTMDPLVSVDGVEQLPTPEETTAGRIVAAGGSARASTVSVTDGDAVQQLFRDLVDELGGLDGVVNVAGITRPTGFAKGAEGDWLDVLDVHLGGYLNILRAALPIMCEQGHGCILGVTSGSGWRPADTGAYGCAKRAVAALTWQLGRLVPPGVVVNAMSPIAATRMVTAALARAGAATAARAKPAGHETPTKERGSSATGGLSLGSMPGPEQLGTLGAHLVGDDLTWCSGQVVFAAGSEVAVVQPPGLLEVVRSEGAASLASVLETVTSGALTRAEASQTTTGGSNPRFGSIYTEAGPAAAAAAVRSCAVVTDRPEMASALRSALETRGVVCDLVPAPGDVRGFTAAADALASSVARAGSVDAVVVAMAGDRPSGDGGTDWEQALASHAGLAAQIHADASWARAVAEHAAATVAPVRLVTLTDATSAGGRSRAQAAAQLARAALGATEERVAAFAVSVETGEAGAVGPAAELAAHLLCGQETPALSGAELVAGAGWFGLRSHPRPSGSIVYGGPALPPWFDEALRGIVDGPAGQG